MEVDDDPEPLQDSKDSPLATEVPAVVDDEVSGVPDNYLRNLATFATREKERIEKEKAKKGKKKVLDLSKFRKPK